MTTPVMHRKKAQNPQQFLVFCAVAAAAGLVMIIIGLILGHVKVSVDGYGSISALQANKLCSTGLGSLAQSFSSTASSDCNTAGAVAFFHGFFIGFGWFFLIVGAIGVAITWRKAEEFRSKLAPASRTATASPAMQPVPPVTPKLPEPATAPAPPPPSPPVPPAS